MLVNTVGIPVRLSPVPAIYSAYYGIWCIADRCDNGKKDLIEDAHALLQRGKYIDKSLLP